MSHCGALHAASQIHRRLNQFRGVRLALKPPSCHSPNAGVTTEAGRPPRLSKANCARQNQDTPREVISETSESVKSGVRTGSVRCQNVRRRALMSGFVLMVCPRNDAASYYRDAMLLVLRFFFNATTQVRNCLIKRKEFLSAWFLVYEYLPVVS